MAQFVSEDETISLSRNIPAKYLIKDAIDIMHHLGLSALKKGCFTETWKHIILRYTIEIQFIIQSLKSFFFLSLYLNMSQEKVRQNERIFICLGDLAYFMPEIRIHWNVVLIAVYVDLSLRHFLHMRYKKDKWLDLLTCVTGEIKPLDIGLNHIEDIERILKR